MVDQKEGARETSYAKTVGNWGEKLARRYLMAKKYRILDTNVYVGKQELDIVAVHNKVLVGIEVKTAMVTRETLQTGDYVRPSQHLTEKKLRDTYTALQGYVRSKQLALQEVQYRMDALLLLVDRNGTDVYVKHIQDVRAF